ncbi:MAG: O-antigen ligase family protein [Sphingomonadales bacterium]
MHLYLVVFAMYTYFNKGIAYGFFAEAVLLLGLLLLLIDLKNYVIPYSRSVAAILIFIAAAISWSVPALTSQPVAAVLKDAAVLLYPGFVLVVFLFLPYWKQFTKGLITIYAFYPIVAFISLQISINFPKWVEFSLFNDVSLLLVKFGDMAVHLLISTLLLLAGYIKLDRRLLLINAVLIVYLILMVATFTRGGFFAYLIGVGLFFWGYRKKFNAATLRSYLLVFSIFFTAAIFFYINTRAEENFQGRAVGVEQLWLNIKTVFSNEEDGALTDNKLWRLAWWYKIISDAKDPVTAIKGVGPGPNLALLGDVAAEDESLRSPHNVSLTIMARFGIPMLLVWLFWLYITLIRPIQSNQLSAFCRVMALVMLAAFFNASFDVYLEGPMGGFLFWTLAGVLLSQHFLDTKVETLTNEKNP